MSERPTYALNGNRYNFTGRSDVVAVIDAALHYAREGELKAPAATSFIQSPAKVIKMAVYSVAKGVTIYEVDGKNYLPFPEYKEMVDIVVTNVKKYLGEQEIHPDARPPEKAAGAER